MYEHDSCGIHQIFKFQKGNLIYKNAFAQRCAAYEKILYLDMGLFNCMETVEGNANGMDEIIFAMKSRRNILPLKLVSAVSTTTDGIFTYDSCSDIYAIIYIIDESDIGKKNEALPVNTRIVQKTVNGICENAPSNVPVFICI